VACHHRTARSIKVVLCAIPLLRPTTDKLVDVGYEFAADAGEAGVVGWGVGVDNKRDRHLRFPLGDSAIQNPARSNKRRLVVLSALT
jgi:hypothetical protein